MKKIYLLRWKNLVDKISFKYRYRYSERGFGES